MPSHIDICTRIYTQKNEHVQDCSAYYNINVTCDVHLPVTNFAEELAKSYISIQCQKTGSRWLGYRNYDGIRWIRCDNANFIKLVVHTLHNPNIPWWLFQPGSTQFTFYILPHDFQSIPFDSSPTFDGWDISALL